MKSENWDAIKKQEKGQKTASDTLYSVPKVLPGLDAQSEGAETCCQNRI